MLCHSHKVILHMKVFVTNVGAHPVCIELLYEMYVKRHPSIQEEDSLK